MFFLAVTGDIRDIKPPVYFKTNFTILLFLLLLVLLGGLVLLAFFVYKKAKERKKELPGPSAKSAYEIACEALEKLRGEA